MFTLSNKGTFIFLFTCFKDAAQSKVNLAQSKLNVAQSKSNVAQSKVNVAQSNDTRCNFDIHDDVKEYIDGLGGLLVRHMKASGFAGRTGFLSVSTKVVKWFRKEFGLNKTKWRTISQAEFAKLEWDPEIYRDGNANDISRCLNLELKLNKERSNICWGRDKAGKIVKKIKPILPQLNFKFSRRIIDETSVANSLDSSINRSIENNFVNQ